MQPAFNPSGCTWRDRVLLDKMSIRMVCALLPVCVLRKHFRLDTNSTETASLRHLLPRCSCQEIPLIAMGSQLLCARSSCPMRHCTGPI